MESDCSKPAPRGLTLFEVLIVIGMMAVFILAVSGAQIRSMLMTRQCAERATAALAARQKIEEMSAMKFDDVYARYGPTGPLRTFDVILDYTLAPGKIEGKCVLPGLVIDASGLPVAAGEVVIVTNESKLATDYGRDLSPADGNPDGVATQGFPFDLTGNGTTNDGDCWPATGQKKGVVFPVGVIIRWRGVQGEERYELWSVLSRM